MARVTQAKRGRFRRGMAVVEAAFVLPFVIYITLGGLEYANLFFRQQQITNAARQGARYGAVPSATQSKVTTTVDAMMTAAGMGKAGAKGWAYTVSTTPADVSTAATGDLITVTLTVPASKVQLITNLKIPYPASLEAKVTMAKEGP